METTALMNDKFPVKLAGFTSPPHCQGGIGRFYINFDHTLGLYTPARGQERIHLGITLTQRVPHTERIKIIQRRYILKKDQIIIVFPDPCLKYFRLPVEHTYT